MKNFTGLLLVVFLSCGFMWAVPEQEDETAIKAVILSAYRDGLCNVGDVEPSGKVFTPNSACWGSRTTP